MPKKKAKLKCGIGAQCSVFAKYLHPAIDIGERYPNATAKKRVDKLLAIRRDKKIVKKKSRLLSFFDTIILRTLRYMRLRDG